MITTTFAPLDATRATTPARASAADDFLARFYRQMGLYAVAAALNVPLEADRTTARDASSALGRELRQAA